MASGPVVAIVFEGLDAVKTGRAMLGATNPLVSPIGMYLYYCIRLDHILIFAGSIRGDYALAVGRNIIHGSDSVESAENEIKLYAFDPCSSGNKTNYIFPGGSRRV